MAKIASFGQNKYLQSGVIAVLILYQMVRLIIFVNIYGGVEHDSGWFLSVARSLAEHGTYTTLVSTMLDPNVPAGFDVNHEFFQVQDTEGRIYFFIEATVGPTQVIPDALVIKLLGSGFWQFRAASLTFYLLFLILASWLLLTVGGFWAALLFQLYIFFYPHLSVFLGYESLGEVPAISFVILSFYLFARATTAVHHRRRWFWLSGLAAGLALLAKLISLLSLSSLGLLWLILYVQKKVTLKEGLLTAAGVVILLLAWEVAQLVTIMSLFGSDIYFSHLQSRLNLFLIDGSGVGQRGSGGIEFIWYKLLLISEISQPHLILSLLNLLVIIASGPFLIAYWRSNHFNRNLVILLWSGWLAHSLWFIFVSENGWVRHTWAAFILAILLVSLTWAAWLNWAKAWPHLFTLGTAIALTLLLATNFYQQRQAASLFISDGLVETWRNKQLTTARTHLPWMLIPRAEQEAAAAVLQNLPNSAHVFYPIGHKSVEMAAVTGRIFYLLERRPFMTSTADDVVLVGPSLISPWTKLIERPMNQGEWQGLMTEVMRQVKQQCPQPIFENSYYIICKLTETNLSSLSGNHK
jgi:hypothetical protein